MSTLFFDVALVRRLVTHARAATKHRAAYGQRAVPALLLVGDHGVYLMSSGIDPVLPRDDGKAGSLVAYARGTDPALNPDGFYDAKVDLYGGDDGCDALPLAHVMSALTLYEVAGEVWMEVKMTRGSISLLAPRAKAPKRMGARPSPKRRPAPKRKASVAEVLDHDCMEHARPYTSDGALGHGFECGRCGAFLQAG